MSPLDWIQFVANFALFALCFEVLWPMRLRSPQLRGFVFILVAVCAVVGMAAAWSRASDANADALLALATCLLMLVGCRPVHRH